MDPTIKDFEAAINELDGIVKKLEEGDLPLEKSLELYERGVQLSRFCHARLEDPYQRRRPQSGDFALSRRRAHAALVHHL